MVNVYRTMENRFCFFFPWDNYTWTTHELSMAMFNSYDKLPGGKQQKGWGFSLQEKTLKIPEGKHTRSEHEDLLNSQNGIRMAIFTQT